MTSTENPTVMPQTRWFEADLKTLRLEQVGLSGWPAGTQSARTRMQEECFESVVALNLDLLFQHEDLLLVATQSPINPMADVIAIDPFGFLRLMELKKTPARLDELQDQVISYGVNRDFFPSWDHQLAERLSDLPERIEIGVEGFKLNERAKARGASYVGVPKAFWRRKNRFEMAHLLANALRARRGLPPGPPACQSPVVADISARLYGVSLTELISEDLDVLLERIVRRRWGRRPSVSGVEFTLIAPSLKRDVDSFIPLEDRGVYFYLIDAELRHIMGERGVERAILKWCPVRRTISESNLPTAMALRKLLRERHPEVAAFDRDAECLRLYWNGENAAFLRIEQADDGSRFLVTRADGLTEGLAYLKPKRYVGLRMLRDALSANGVSVHTTRGELAAPWDRENLEPASALAVAYYNLLCDLGLFRLEKYARAKRPKGI